MDKSKQCSLVWHMVPPKSPRNREKLCLCVTVGGLRCNNLSQHSPEYQTPKNITNVADLNLYEFTFYLLAFVPGES